MLKPPHITTPPCKWKDHNWLDTQYVVLKVPDAHQGGHVAILQLCPYCKRIRFLPLVDDGTIEGVDD